ncbi:hypothetical protein Syun_012114 [Stephania yunnanensis]|uniref:Uncharacterized protein n=1 Tax=Stephania yunnanensis TaxID=152371 RepID=A0AAP0JZN2_9MAGN
MSALFNTPPPKSPNPTEKTKSQRNRSPAKSVFTATFIAPNQLFIFISPNQLLIFTATFIATYIPTISCLSDRLVSVLSLLSTLVSPSLAQPIALVTPSLSGHRPPNPQPPTNLSFRSLALNSLSLVFSSLAQPVTPVSLVSLVSPSLSGHRPPNPQPQTSRPRTPLLPALTVIVWIQTHSGMDIGFGISAAAMALGLISLIAALSFIEIIHQGGAYGLLFCSNQAKLQGWYIKPHEVPVKMEFLNLIEKRTVFVYHAEECEEQMVRIMEDPTFKPIVDEIESGGPATMASNGSETEWKNSVSDSIANQKQNQGGK